MIYTPRAGDAQLLSFSRELVRDALKILRDSDHIARAQRVRDGLVAVEPVRGEGDPV
ncbi:DNA-binding FadR family transcriptional regulator [Bradyrhizobium huanghuaihaiense]|uniref:Uncharacterized protein n=1 Tax=Bradyrhizobium huanghuaihaiense TaxID=990078 RepID=A0A562RPJ5_9BRAD|nr:MULTISPECIES: hypothetical protein [Bradyrhizobium]TWI70958.1 hypothetical protein IQ16_03372 [Bradyrhizobium huanghuaihaiense]UWU80867.1 hypothetical protein N2603_21090 [Bradyrhizobium sp. CB3035]